MRLSTSLAARGALALCGALLLAACDPGQATSPEAVVGSILPYTLVFDRMAASARFPWAMVADGAHRRR